MLLCGLRKRVICIVQRNIIQSHPSQRAFHTGFITNCRFRSYLRSIISNMAERNVEKQLPVEENLQEKKPSKKKTKKTNKAEIAGTTKRGIPKNNRNKQSNNSNKGQKQAANMPEFLLSANPTSNETLQTCKQTEDDRNGKKEQRKARSGTKQNLPEMKFENYISEENCSEGLKTGKLIQGSLRINPRSFNDAYISSLGGKERDIYLEGVISRNRALPGDIVAVKILSKDKWKESNHGNLHKREDSETGDTPPIKTGKVVYIIEKKHPRVACGFLKPYRGNAFGFALLSPVDNRLPRMMIPLNECPPDFKSNADTLAKTLFLANITSWNVNMAFASGELMRSLGEAGHIEPETEAMLTSNDIDSSPFSEEVIQCLPNGKSWSISENELKKRKDMRSECIFTIDPATARDLDDALSCKDLGDGVYEVGVHIADVTHFIDQHTALDKEAKKRATSVYLVQRVVPMLPRVLCEQLCSLNPGVDRLAYSVIWKLRSDGTILSEWFGRTVIRSCTKLSYDHAQRMIQAEEELVEENFPTISGDFPLEKIQETVKLLYGLSVHLRQRRFDSGALRLDQPKLAFTLDSEKGTPNGCYIYQYKDSNRMIEEFMLLANMAVGHKIYESHPEKAILRSHPPPQEMMMKDVEEICRKFEIPFDISDSKSISKSLGDVEQSDVSESLLPALTLLCTKPFQNAKYFCTGTVDDETAYRHYALNVPIYTHFTSPIRRYPDVMVHRLLTAALDNNFEVHGEKEELQSTAAHCNDKKWAAKKVSEQSSQLFFAVYLLEAGPLTEKGVVVGVLAKAIDVLCTRVGIVTRVYMDKLPLWKYEVTLDGVKPTMTLSWKNEKDFDIDLLGDGSDADQLKALTKMMEEKWKMQKKEQSTDHAKIPNDAVSQQLTMFSPVHVVLSVDRKTPTKINGIIGNPAADQVPALQL